MCSPNRPVFRLSWKSEADGLKLLDEIGHVFMENLGDAINARQGDYKALRAMELEIGNLLARCHSLAGEAFQAMEREKYAQRSALPKFNVLMP